MNEIHRILELLQDTDEASVRFEQLTRDNPDDLANLVNVRAVRKRRADLERRLNAELRTSQADLVQYHIKKTEEDRYPVVAVAEAISGFQQLVTSVFDALRSTPKKRYRPQPDNVALSTLDLAMALPVGSVLVSMSIENNRLLAIQSELDQTFERVFEILNTRDSEHLRQLADVVGIASIAKAHDWAASAAWHGLNTKIEIQKDTTKEPRRFEISNSQAQTLMEVIEEKSDKEIEPETVMGELIGIDVDPDPDRTYFHIETNDKRTLTGQLDVSFPRDQHWAVHVIYTARVAKVTTTKYATGEERIEWVLVHLQPFEGGFTQR